ncbi:MAG: hypothetical protein J0L84_03185 [Verrucomicrobia bacterium]|nr:hypothetical protein [Verrucomicrobiota bacterium]
MSTPANEPDALAQLRTAQDALKAMTTERDTLQGQVKTLTTERDTATGQVTTLTKERDEALGKVTAVTGERDKAKADLAAVTTDRDALKAEETTLTAALAKHGISPTAVTTPPPAAGPSGEAKGKDAELMAEYEAVQHDPKKLSALLSDKEKGARLRAIIQSN